MVTLTIDGRIATVPEGTSILEAAKTVGIEIPTLCYLKEINEIGACRICCVEIEGNDLLVPACDNAVAEGMVIHTNSPKAREAREVNLQLILSQHEVNCTKCTRNGNCKLQKLCAEHNLLEDWYDRSLKSRPVDRTSPIVRHENRCIQCMRCVQVCDKVQAMKIWDLFGTGSRAHIGISGGKTLADAMCTFCGQCVTHCPVGALEERDDTAAVYKALSDPEKITVVQVAPAVRSAWAEDFAIDPASATPGRMTSALRELGFNYVFDTNFAADLTIMEEGSELLARLGSRNSYPWPMFTSCCPGWVRFIKGQFPSYAENLSTAKSPQQMFGAIAKSYFAEKLGVDPSKLFVVSVMPCISKKQEAELPSMRSNGADPDVDAVLTTREMVRMLHTAHLNPAFLAESEFDSPLGSSTGAAVIFGASGGVMDAALRSAYFLVTGKNPDADAFTKVRGTDGWKEAVFTIPGFGDLSVAVVSGLGNTRKLMEAIDAGNVHYDFVEVMACPGGCAGGGGQPIHDGQELAGDRGNILWNLDAASTVRFSHENKDIQALYAEYLEKPLSEKAHMLLHTEI